VKRRALAIIIVTIAIGLAAVGFVFAFGTPQAPPPGSSGVPNATTDNASSSVGSTGAAPSLSATAEVPPPDPNSPLMVEIPGCVCHSDDSALVEEHAGYRMNQCFGCHTGGMPEMVR
jgi:hypothetical protein